MKVFIFIGLQKVKGHTYRNFKNLYQMNDVTAHKSFSEKWYYLSFSRVQSFGQFQLVSLVLIENIHDFFHLRA